MAETLTAVPHADLTGGLLDGVRALFNAEYCAEFGNWNPDQPYGYAPHDIHIIAQDDAGQVIGHTGWGSRQITVEEQTVHIAGVGGVLVSAAHRKTGLGKHLLKAATDTMQIMNTQGIVPIDFGYLGCREEVVGFYESCGFTRISAREFYTSTNGEPAVADAQEPLLIFPVAQADFPRGDIDLNGRPW